MHDFHYFVIGGRSVYVNNVILKQIKSPQPGLEIPVLVIDDLI